MRRVTTVLITFLLVAGTSWAQQKINETRAASPDGIVEIHNLAGSVDVVGWSKAETARANAPSSVLFCPATPTTSTAAS